MSEHIALAAVAVLVGAVAQGVTGFGFSLVSAPFLIAAAAAPKGVQWNVMLSAGLNFVLLVAGLRLVRWADVARILAPAVVTTVLFGYVARHADRQALTVAAGLLCLVATGFVASGWRTRRLAGTAGAAIVGGTSGAMNVVAGIGGPPVVVYGLNAGWPSEVARPTLQAIFFGVNLVAIPSLGVTSVPPVLPIALVVGIVVGMLVGRRLPERTVRVAVLAIAAAGSVLAVFRGLGML